MVKRLHHLSLVPQSTPDLPHLKRCKGTDLYSGTQKLSPSFSCFFSRGKGGMKKKDKDELKERTCEGKGSLFF